MRSYLAAVALVVLVVAGLLAHFGAIKHGHINADTLYATALYRDLFVDRYDVRGWNLTPAPSFFPDMLMMFPLLRLTGDLGLAYLGYTLAQYLLTLAALVSVARLYTRDLPEAMIAIFTAGAFLVALLQRGNYVFLAAPILSISHHGSVFLAGTVVLWIALRATQHGYSPATAAVFVLVSAPTIFSDMLLVSWFLAPLTLTALIFSVFRWLPFRFFVTTAALAAVSVFVGVGGVRLCQASGIFRWNPAVAELTLATVMRALTTPRVLRSYLGLGPFFPALLVAFVAWLPLAVGLYVGEARAARGTGAGHARTARQRARLVLFLITFALLSMGASVLGPFAKARNAIWVFRYFHPLVLLPPFVLAILTAMYRGPAARYVKGGACAAAVVFALYVYAPPLSSLRFAALRSPYPDLVRCIDEAVSRYGVDYGYCGYWDSKYLTILSRSGARFNLVSREVTPWHIANNPAWYHMPPGGRGGGYPRYEFVVAGEQWAPGVRQRFGEPAAANTCSDRVVLIYNRAADVAFRNRIRLPATLGDGPLMDALGLPVHGSTAMPALPTQGNGTGTTGITCAAGRDHYTADGTPPGAAEVVTIEAGRSFVAEFAPSITAEVLEVALMAGPAHTAAFFLGARPLGELGIPATEGEAVRIHYLQLPDSVRGSAFDRVVITPVGPTAASAVGHLCYYDDSG